MAQGHNNSAKSNWWFAEVVGKLLHMQIGNCSSASDGQGYNKPTAADLQKPSLREALQQRLQIDANEIMATLKASHAPVHLRRPQPQPSVPNVMDLDGDGADGAAPLADASALGAASAAPVPRRASPPHALVFPNHWQGPGPAFAAVQHQCVGAQLMSLGAPSWQSSQGAFGGMNPHFQLAQHGNSAFQLAPPGAMGLWPAAGSASAVPVPVGYPTFSGLAGMSVSDAVAAQHAAALQASIPAMDLSGAPPPVKRERTDASVGPHAPAPALLQQADRASLPDVLRSGADAIGGRCSPVTAAALDGSL